MVEHALFGGVIHQLPEEGDNQGGGEVGQEVKGSEEDLTARNLGEEDGQDDWGEEAECQGQEDVL